MPGGRSLEVADTFSGGDGEMEILTHTFSPGTHRHSPSAKSWEPELLPNRNFCQCSGCGFFFLSVAAFEKHRVGPAADRSCTTTPQLPDAGLLLDAHGYWRLPKRKFVKPAPKLRVVT